MSKFVNTLSTATQSVIEQVETRSLLSITLVGTDLQIKGTHNSDVITVDSDESPSRIRVQVNHVIRRFNTSAVRSMLIEGLKGDDDVLIKANVAKPADIFGDAGFDTLIGGSGRDSI